MYDVRRNMTYKQAVSYLYSLEEERINLGLSRIKSLLSHLYISPHDLKVIHVAGTNGKGSVVAMISSILSCAGFKVGVYTSPHLKDFRERIAIKSKVPPHRRVALGDKVSTNQKVKYIPKKELVRLVEKIKPIVKKISRTELGKPTFFEVTTAIMFAHFIEEKVDFAVLEVGLGGRLDATNVVLPIACVITSIGLEHTDRLGTTLEKIAREKCGIIKNGCPVVTAEQRPEVLKVIKNISRNRKAKLIRVGRDVRYKFEGFNGKLQFFSYSGLFKNFRRLPLPLLGKYQLANASCAIAAIEILGKVGTGKVGTAPPAFLRKQEGGAVPTFLSSVCPYFSISNGLRYTEWPGRCEVVSRRPFVVTDGAHNPPAARALTHTIKNYFKYDSLILILGILRDKDVEGIMNYLLPLADSIIFTSPASLRATSPLELMERAPSIVRHTSIFITSNVTQAVRIARQIASKKDLILITGSLYTVADARKSLLR